MQGPSIADGGSTSGAASALLLPDTVAAPERTEQLEEVAVPVTPLGPLPRLRLAAARPLVDPALVMRTAPDGPEAVAYRHLRARLRRHGDPQVIALSGAHPGAGTSAAAANLAIALTEGRRDVLLVDDDVRSPSLHRLLDLPRGPLDREATIGGLALPDRRLVSYLPRLDVLACADDPERPSEGIGDAIAVLREQYDYVIVDLAPGLERVPAVDAVLVVSRGDGGLLRIAMARPFAT